MLAFSCTCHCSNCGFASFPETSLFSSSIPLLLLFVASASHGSPLHICKVKFYPFFKAKAMSRLFHGTLFPHPKGVFFPMFWLRIYFDIVSIKHISHEYSHLYTSCVPRITAAFRAATISCLSCCASLSHTNTELRMLNVKTFYFVVILESSSFWF